MDFQQENMNSRKQEIKGADLSLLRLPPVFIPSCFPV
jgi:hypothetical protein